MAASLLTRTKAKVDLYTSTKVRGLIAGRGRSLAKGTGEDFDDLSAYHPGDKISDIDWKATARSGEPVVRKFNESRVRHLGIVADTSAAMAAQAADGTSKKDAMVTIAGLFCFVAQSHGDLVSLIAGSAGAPVTLPGRSSRGHLELILRSIDRIPSLAGPAPDMGWLLNRAFRFTRRASLLLIITDEARPSPVDAPVIRRLKTRHDLLVVRIRDADPLMRTDLSHDVVDVGAPRDLLEGTRASKGVQREADSFREAREREVTAMLDSLHVPHMLTDGDSAAVEDFLAFLRRQEARRGRP